MGVTIITNPLATDLDHILDHTRGLWEELRSERVFITGGTGFFGCWLMESFLWANDRLKLNAGVTILTRSPESFHAKVPHLARHKAVTIIEGDVRTFRFPKGKFSHIIHAATESSAQPKDIDPLEKFTSNVEGTRKVLDFAVKSGAGKFLFTSSGAVYGKQPSEITHIPETYVGAPETTDPNTAYGQSKRASEFLCTAATTATFQAKIARCFAFAGPYLPLNSNYAIGNFIRDAMQGNPIFIQGDGTPYRSYLYSADLAIWLWTILFKGKPAHPYNVGSDADLAIAQLAREVVENIAPQLHIEIARRPATNQPAQRYVPSIQRARNELGLDVKIELTEAIQRMAKFYSQ